jgi:hypothetical protein
MKILNLLVVVLAMVVVSCKKDSTVEPTKEVVADNTQIVSLSIGNKYYVANSEFTGSVVYSWGQTKSILRDTTIMNNKYYLFSSGEILRSSSYSLLQWNGSSETILYRYDVKVGDSITYQGRQLKIISISTDTVFVGTQKIFDASNVGLTVDTTVSLTYASKFGLISSRKSISNKSWNSTLAGAKIDTTTYGFIK